MRALMADTELHRAARAGPASNLSQLLANPNIKRNINQKDGYCVQLPATRLAFPLFNIRLLFSELALLVVLLIERLTLRCRQQRTPLHVAAEEGARDKVLLLLSNGADPAATDRNGWTPLHCAASQVQSERSLSSLRLLSQTMIGQI